MRTLFTSVIGLVLGVVISVSASEAPQGDLLELHSCQLYIGGCIASSEITQEGQYLLRVWNFSGGTHAGASLRGFQIALLEASDQNLAVGGTQPSDAVVYLPQSASRTEAAALLDWLTTANRQLSRTKLQVRTVPMSLSHAHNTITFSAGNFLQIETTPFTPCGLISCGESLWYAPRSTFDSYTVGVTSKAVVREPALALQWIDHGKNNIFEGHFGKGTPALATFTPPALVCVADHARHE